MTVTLTLQSSSTKRKTKELMISPHHHHITKSYYTESGVDKPSNESEAEDPSQTPVGVVAAGRSSRKYMDFRRIGVLCRVEALNFFWLA